MASCSWRALLLVAFVVPLACSTEVEQAEACRFSVERRGRVLVVGIDGADPGVVARLRGEGRLPHLDGIAKAGFGDRLRSHFPLLSPRIWNSVATGKKPEKHGITGFVRRDDDGEQRLFLSSHRQGHALWNIASDACLDVGVVNWWTTYPPERVRGVMITDHVAAEEIDGRRAMWKAAPHAERAPWAYPAEWQARVLASLDAAEATEDPDNPFRGDSGLPAWIDRETLAKRYEADAWLTELALELDAAERPDLLMLYLPGIDVVSHFLWGSLGPESPEFSGAERDAGRAALLDYYAYTDALIGRLLARFSDDDLVLVVSDHGFERPERPMPNLTGNHGSRDAEFGVVFARGPGIAAGAPEPERTLSVNDVTPTVLAWWGLPVARDMDGRVAPFLGVSPAPPIDTYDDGAIERATADESGSEEAILERLRTLGYIE